MTTDLPYRPCVGIVLVNADGLIFTGERIDTPGAWQMPQGGIDDGEDATAAAFRELEEETGVSAAHVRLLDETQDWVLYDLPDHLVGKLWKGRFKGQKQRWYLMRFQGCDTDIQIKQAHQEFARWRWSTPDQVIANIVPFKQSVYQQVMNAFRDQL